MNIFTDELSNQSLFEQMKEQVAKRAVNYHDVATFIATSQPECKQQIIEQADLALRGMLTLPGTNAQPFFVGTPPKWHEDPVGDDEYVWVLNRTEHWLVLMQAYFLTGQTCYANKVVEELEDWITVCKRPDLHLELWQYNAAMPWRTLEAGIRMYRTWSWVLEMLFAADAMTPALLERFAKSVHEHCQYLYEISPRLFPNADHNHYFMEMLGLLFGSAMFPQFAQSTEWVAFATDELVRCAKAQFTEDGGQIEGCPHYHNLCVSLLWTAFMGAKKYGLVLPQQLLQSARAAIDYSLHAQRPSGTIVPWGDSDADETSIRAAVEGYLMLGDRTWIDLILQMGHADRVKAFFAEYVWMAPEAIECLEGDFLSPRPIAFPLCNHQKHLKQAMMRTAWTQDALSVFFACNTPTENGHAHIDPMGFDFTAGGKPLLVDPGRFCYREDQDRRNFKSPQWHNTLLVNNKPPFEYVTTWSFGPQKYGTIERIEQQPGFVAAYAVQHSYEPAVHRRMVAIVDGAFLLVADRLDGLSHQDTVQLFYHIDSPAVTLKQEDCTANSEHVSVRYQNGLVATVHDGKVSDALDVSRPSTILKLDDGVGSDATRVYLTLCLPQKMADQKMKVTYQITQNSVKIQINKREIDWKTV